MGKQAVHSGRVPTAFGNYSTAIRHGNMLFLAGQGPFDLERRLVGEGDLAVQIHRTMYNIRCLLEDNGFGLDDIVRSTVYLSDIADWSAFNEIYGTYFTPPYPARTVVACQLNGFLVEIECTAIRD
ncbi:RidA family protein [Paenibacillus eucommiae]|uniref:2-iminobutanoate/2-iminopropanoate deaminase n=1 Tax=Paenibacillus eucommiae TaxID=1355755 RepID=A0ABS4J043_9BACL|nr:Rid family hydrolase [Paenibacillus eucommiae]MBP1993207.1 2-iminobutanoate/2-iminopropanoate deaminase [Paenibacillus eucommiae]